MNCTSPLLRIDANKYFFSEKRVRNGGYFFPLAELDNISHYVPSEDLQLIPCGSCIACRINYSRDWAIRLQLESKEWKYSYFVTLTYDDDHLKPCRCYDPSDKTFKDFSLDLKDFQKFMKRLRNLHGSRISVFYCGEYGELYDRPHWHAIFFTNKEIPLEFYYKRDMISYYKSRYIDNVWEKGYVIVTDTNFQAFAYVARYMLKKVKGRDFNDEVKAFQNSGSDVPLRVQPFCHMSIRPAIAKRYFINNMLLQSSDDDFKTTVLIPFEKDYRGFLAKPPRYFDKLFDGVFPQRFKVYKDKKKVRSLLYNNFGESKLSRLARESIMNERKSKFYARKIL